MHMRTKALVLRETAYKESDKILTLLTQEAGKLTASGRGCRKKGSPIAAGCQLLVWSDMVLYEHRGRWAVQEAAVEREFRGMRDDLVKLALGCYGAEVTELLAVEGVPNPELLSLLLNSLHALDKLDRPPALVKAAFELRCLCLAGYGPLLDACAVCGREPPEEPRFHLREGVLHCAACRGEVGDGISMPVDGGVLERVPVRALRSMRPRPDVIVAVDVLGNLLHRNSEPPTNLINCFLRYVDVIDTRVTQQKKMVFKRHNGLWLEPDLGNMDQYQVKNLPFAYEQGYRLGKENAGAIRELIES